MDEINCAHVQRHDVCLCLRVRSFVFHRFEGGKRWRRDVEYCRSSLLDSLLLEVVLMKTTSRGGSAACLFFCRPALTSGRNSTLRVDCRRRRLFRRGDRGSRIYTPRSSMEEAFRGAVRTLSHLPTTRRRLQFLAYFSKLVFDAQIFNLKHLDVVVRTAGYLLRKENDPQRPRSSTSYGKHSRQKLEVHYQSDLQRAPVVLFVPGGAWGAADVVTYALLGRSIADQGAVAVVMEYRSYPSGRVDDMIDDVGLAMDWVVANAAKFGGDPKRLVLFGHSAGAHLAFLNIWRRARDDDDDDARILPVVFIGSCGVYNISHHYNYEAWRGVSELSTMKPAMGGPDSFDDQSPSTILDREGLPQRKRSSRGDPPATIKTTLNLTSAMDRVHLDGDRAARRAGFDASMPSEENSLPLCVLLTSGRDATVPWHTTAEFFCALYDDNSKATEPTTSSCTPTTTKRQTTY